MFVQGNHFTIENEFFGREFFERLKQFVVFEAELFARTGDEFNFAIALDGKRAGRGAG